MDFKKGDVLIEMGGVFKVVEVGDKEGFKGGVEPHITYRPFFEIANGREIECSIPISSLEKTSIRKPFSKTGINKILKGLKKDLIDNDLDSVLLSEDAIKSNNIEDLIPVIKKLRTERRDSDTGLSNSKKYLYKKLMRSVVNETAVVLGLSQETAEKRIEKELKLFVGKN